MIWQDLTISAVSILFAYALIPQVYQGFKNKEGVINSQTSLINVFGLYVLAITMFTLQLYLSTILYMLVGTLWLLLFIQKIIY